MIELASRQALGVAVPALWEIVYAGISGKIAEGIEGYRPGDELPTILSLASEYKVGQSTVKLALFALGRDGWTRGQQGKRTFVADTPPITR